MRIAQPEPAVPAPPQSCPFCRSAKVSTASEKIDSSTYWRCEACGEMWNAGRLQAANRNHYGGGRRF